MRAVPDSLVIDENSPSYAVACFKAGLLGTRPMDETCEQSPGRKRLEKHLLKRMKSWFEEIRLEQLENNIEFPEQLSASPTFEELQRVFDSAYEEMRFEWHCPADLKGDLDYVISPEQVAADLAPERGTDARSQRRARLYHSIISVRQMSLAAFCLRETSHNPKHEPNLSSAALHAGIAHSHFTYLYSEMDADTLTISELRAINELGARA